MQKVNFSQYTEAVIKISYFPEPKIFQYKQNFQAPLKMQVTS